MEMKPKVVDVTPIEPSPTHGPWQVAHGNGVSNQANSYPDVVLPYAAGDYPITFNIKGSNDLTFDEAAPGGAIWTKANGKPTSAASDSHIHDITVSNGGKTLTLIDTKADTTNVKPLKLHYQLNFKGGDQNHKKLDPIILNDGGGKTIFGYSYQQVAQAAAVALVVILIAVFAYRQLSARNASVK